MKDTVSFRNRIDIKIYFFWCKTNPLLSVDEAVLDDEPDVDSGRVSKAGTPGGDNLQLVNFGRHK